MAQSATGSKSRSSTSKSRSTNGRRSSSRPRSSNGRAQDQRNTLAFELQRNTLAFDTAPLDLSGQCPGEGETGRLEGDRGSREWRPEWRAHRREDRRKSEMAGDGWRRGLGGTRGRRGSREQALNRQAERTAASSRRRHRQEPGKGWGEPRTVRRERRPVRFRDAKDARGNRERVQAQLTNRGSPEGSHGPPVAARRSLGAPDAPPRWGSLMQCAYGLRVASDESR